MTTEIYIPKENTYPEGAVTIARGVAQEPGFVKFAPMGGGFVYRMPEAEFESTFRKVAKNEINNVQFRAAEFNIDDVYEEPIPGYTTGTLWNGWAMPVFEKEAVMKLAQVGSDITFDEEKDTFIVDMGEDVDDDCRFEEYVGFDISFEGELKHVYAIGDGWCWNEIRVEDEQ